MKGLTPYLNFDGNTREAMTFYADCLGAKLDIQTFKDVGMSDPPESADRVIHARVSKGSTVLMASDPPVGMAVTQGDNVWINIDCEDVDEIERLFKAFGDGAKVIMELQDTFWGARFGMLRDKFGIGWMFNCELPPKA